MNTTLIEAANNYLSCALSVMPVRDNKRPYGEWETFQRRAVAQSETERLFGSAWGIAIIGGAVSGGLEFIDFDSHSKDIDRIFQQFTSDEKAAFIISRHHPYIEKSMNGGYHIAYTYECSGRRDGSMKLSEWENGDSMIETRAEGGYCITYPTAGYTVISGDLEELPYISYDERTYLIELAKSFNEKTASSTSEPYNNKDKAVFDNTDPISWFNWYKASYTKKILEEKGWRKLRYDEREDIEYWQRPGKDATDDSWSATWGRKHNALYVFTSSVNYFIPKAYYTPFQILVRLRFDNDAVKAIQWIVDKYKTTDLDYTNVMPVDRTEPPPPAHDATHPPPINSFPVDVFPTDVQRFIHELHTSLNYSPEFLSVAIMFTIATLNGNKFKLRVKDPWIAPTIFWFAVVGDPGTMKSHPISTIIKPIKRIDIDSKKIHDEEMMHYENEQAETKGKKTLKKPKFKQILINDITLESIHEVHNFNKRGLGYYKDELVGFINTMNQYRKGGDEQFWLESFNNDSYTVNRVSKPTIVIEDTNINIIGTIQPSVLSKITKDYDGNGLTDRFLYTAAETNTYPMNAKTIDPGWITWWEKSIRNANTHFQYLDNADSIILDTPQDVLQRIISIDEGVVAVQNSEDTTDAMKSYLGKRKTYLPRFVLLMALIDNIFSNGDLTINISHVDRADKVLRYFIDSAIEVSGESSKISEISELLNAKKGLTTKEKIILLHQKGVKSIDIAKYCGVSRANVSKTLSKIK